MNKRYFLLFFLTITLLNSLTTFGQNEIKIASFELKSGTSGKEVIGSSHAVAGATIDIAFDVSVEEETELKRFNGYEIKRGESSISGKDKDSFSPTVGQDQKVTYTATFFCETRQKLPNGTYTDWVDDPNQNESHSIETPEFNIYPTPVAPTTSVKDFSTYVGADAKTLSFTYDSNSGNTDGWNIVWSIDNNEVSGESSTSLQFNPEEVGTHTIKVVCRDLAPDNTTVWLEWSKEWTVKVYASPVQSSDITISAQPEGAKKNTYAGRKNDIKTYEIYINQTGEAWAPKWIFEWDNYEATDSKLSLDPEKLQAGNYTPRVKCTCVNPDDETDIWAGPYTKDFETLKVYSAPVAPVVQKPTYSNSHVGREFDKSFKLITNQTGGNWSYTIIGIAQTEYTIPVDQKVEDGNISYTWKNVNPDDTEDVWMEMNNGVYNYKVYDAPVVSEEDMITWPSNVILEGNSISMSVTPDGGYSEGWSYEWTQTEGNGTITGKTESAATYESVNADCGKNVQFTLTVKNMSPDNVEWYKKTFNAPKTLEVYKNPTVTPKDKHYASAKKDDNVYAIFSGETFDLSELFDFDGGFDTSYGHESGWDVEYTVNGVSPESSIFDKKNVGEYTIDVKLTNTATLSDNSTDEWITETLHYTFNVLTYPEISHNLDKYTTEGQSAWNMLNGEQATIIINKDAGPEAWKFEWSKNNVVDQENTSNEYVFDAINTGSKDSESYTIKVFVSNIPDNIVEPKVFDIIQKTFVVWHEPSMVNVDLENGNWTLETFSGRAETLVMSSVGGKDSNWSVKWEPIGSAPEGVQENQQKNYKYKFENGFGEVKEMTPYQYKLHWEYKFDNGDIDRKCDTIVTVKVWPKPELTIKSLVLGEKSINKGVATEYNIPTISKSSDLDCFSGDKLNLSYTIVGGQTETENQWSVKVNSGSEEYMPYTPGFSINPLDGINTFEPTTSTASKKNTYTIVFSQDYKGDNYTSNSNWFKETYVINATAWKKSSLSEILTDSVASRTWTNSQSTPVDVYAGGYDANKVNFNITKHDGYTNGWNYDWKLGTSTESTNHNTYTYTPSTSQTSELKTVTVHITNKIGNNYDLDKTFTYKMRVWHKADIASEFSIIDNSQSRELVDNYTAVRDGNEVTVSVSPMKYGYANKISDDYKYQWWDNGVQRTSTTDYTWNKTFDESYSKKDEFGSVNKSISMKLNNYGPYGHIWDGTPMKTVNFVVYNRPQVPSTLVKKGNGTSGTMICTTTIKDEELENHDYFLVFGYKDAAGNEHEMARKQQRNPGEVRWDNSFKSYEVDNTNNKFFVYAEWVDQSGVIITSGRRYADGSVDNVWDGSVYSKTTRSEIRGFLAGDADADATGIEDITIAEDGADGSLVAIYDLNGRKVENNNNTSLSPGMYIFRYENAGVVTTKKVCIK